jgi:hypothetical protein
MSDTKLRVITIATLGYSLNAIRLVKSLKRTHPNCEITVYADNIILEPYFYHLGAKLHFLPEIETLGVKRAKFVAYADAAKSGGFVYLDSDIVVIQPLNELTGVNKFTACRDDLDECSYIYDKQQPWKNYPQWAADRYFNSGVFAVPAGFDAFFKMICREAMDDADWASIVIPGKLHDNHYLCAKVVQYDIPVAFVSEYEYNWQGFRRLNELNCYVDEAGILRNKPEGTPLRLVHFAGIQTIDAYIATLPLEITRILATSLGKEETGILEFMNAALSNSGGIEERLKLQLIKSMAVTPCLDRYSPGEDRPLLSEAVSATSIALSTTATDFLWNRLKCGASYLSAAEYKVLRDFIQHHKIGAVLEFGAGYTTALFGKLVKRQVALEGWDGPWMDFALADSCDARITPFYLDVGFDERQLKLAIEDVSSANETSMVFIDSPSGTENRGLIVEQLLKLNPDADYYVFHDSVRDSPNVYRLAATLGLQVIDHFSSWRGLTFLGKAPVSAPTSEQKVADADSCRQVNFAISLIDKDVGAAGVSRVFIELQNIGNVVLPSGRISGMLFSPHLVGPAGEVIAWDTPRYSLPVDLSPGDTVSFWVTIPDEYGPVAALDCDFVKEGEFWWSTIAESTCPRISLI